MSQSRLNFKFKSYPVWVQRNPSRPILALPGRHLGFFLSFLGFPFRPRKNRSLLAGNQTPDSPVQPNPSGFEETSAVKLGAFRDLFAGLQDRGPHGC